MTEEERNERIVREALSRLPGARPPDVLWRSIEESLDREAVPRARRMPWQNWALAAAAVLCIAAWLVIPHGVRWEVVRKTGSQSRTETLGPGDWLQTDAHSSAEVRVGTIGNVEIEPGSRLRVIATRADNHRIQLESGEISATISAPPRLFFVQTKSATAVDLGCQYKMKVDTEGNGLLRVTRGWVSFEWHGRESLVPAGANCKTRAGGGPGTPYFADATPGFIAALNQFDFAGGGQAVLPAILNEARQRDTLTLWHLLSRVDAAHRPAVYDRMVALAAPPAAVSRAQALALDPQTLKIWKDELAWTW